VTRCSPRPSVIAVTSPTIPGLRRLEIALSLLPLAAQVIAVSGSHLPAAGRRQLTPRSGPLTAAALAAKRVCEHPDRQVLALRGLRSSPLPTSLLKAAETLLQHTAVGDHHQKGHPNEHLIASRTAPP
jgi:hypothetical protein